MTEANRTFLAALLLVGGAFMGNLTGCGEGGDDEAAVASPGGEAAGVDGDASLPPTDGAEAAGDGTIPVDGSEGDTPQEPAGMPIDPDNVIDDLDDGDSLIAAVGGRLGAWYTFNDGTADAVQNPAQGEDFLPAEGGPGQSVFFAETSGSGFLVWGAGLGLNLNDGSVEDAEAGTTGTYDASAHTGIAFWGKGNTVAVRFAVGTTATVQVENGGGCVPSEGEEGEAEDDCADTHGKSVRMTEEWQQFVIPFAELRQGGWGQPADFDPSSLIGLSFQTQAEEFQFAVDELGFY